MTPNPTLPRLVTSGPVTSGTTAGASRRAILRLPFSPGARVGTTIADSWLAKKTYSR
jgi:hypothetical protein